MDKEAGVRELVEFIFHKQVTTFEEMVVRNSSIPTRLLTGDFTMKIERILFFMEIVVSLKWKTFFDDHYRKMMLSHQMYLEHVMMACFLEYNRSQDIFESLIRICALAKILSDETLAKTGVSFSELNPEIIMIFFARVLKTAFCKEGGFRRFVKYIHSHRFLERKWKEDNCNRSDDPDRFEFFGPDLTKQFKKEIANLASVDLSEPKQILMYAMSKDMTREVLSNTSVVLPTFPSEYDIIKKIVAFRKNEMAEKSVIEAALQSENVDKALLSLLSPVIVSNTSNVVKHEENIERYEKTIQAVIRHNQSKISDSSKVNNLIQEKADRILEHLKCKIKSLNEVLSEYDKE